MKAKKNRRRAARRRRRRVGSGGGIFGVDVVERLLHLGLVFSIGRGGNRGSHLLWPVVLEESLKLLECDVGSGYGGVEPMSDKETHRHGVEAEALQGIGVTLGTVDRHRAVVVSVVVVRVGVLRVVEGREILQIVSDVLRKI